MLPVAFGDFSQADQPRAPRPARLTHMSEAALDSVAAKPLQALASLSFGAVAIGIHRVAILTRLVAPPRAMVSFRLRYVRAEVAVVAQFDRAGALLTLVSHRFADLHVAPGLLHIHVGFEQAVAKRLGVGRIAALHRHRLQQSAIALHRSGRDVDRVGLPPKETIQRRIARSIP